MKTAYFGAGCFWHVQEEFDNLDVETEVGYMGGDEEKFPNPTYEQVTSNTTRFIEVIKIDYDEENISYEDLLNKWLEIHDPTSVDRQGADHGTQYRSVVFYTDGEQKEQLERVLKEKQKEYKNKIVSEVRPAVKFYKAEKYHQKYNERKGRSYSI